MKMLLSATFFALIIMSIFIGATKKPFLDNYIQCFEQAEAATTESNLISAGTSVQRRCVSDREEFLAVYACFDAADKELDASDNEVGIIKSVARTLTNSTRDIEEIIESHNQRCAGLDGVITEYDLDDIRY